MNIAKSRWVIGMAAAAIGLGVVSCEKKGPLEKAGEEVDEAVDTIKNDGKEPVAAKVDDAIDDAAKKVEKATK